MTGNSPNIWMWQDPDSRWKDDVISYIKNMEPVDQGIVMLNCSNIKDFDESIPLTNYVLNLGQIFKVFENDRMMFLNPKDLFQAIELCLGRLAVKDDSSAVDISDAAIVQCHKAYIDHFGYKDGADWDKKVFHVKKFIEENNCADLWLIYEQLLRSKVNNREIMQYLSNSHILILGSPPSELFKNIINLISITGDIMNITVEMPLNISLQGSPKTPTHSMPEIAVTSDVIKVEEITLDTNGELQLGSASQEYAEDVILAFLSLLVNNRNELALSKAMISPIIDFSHEAFTALKHLAEEKEMPMCQMAISYVTRLKLGGKGYAPSADCPLLPHLKSLELFIDIVNQLQTIIEEDLKPISAIKRLISIMKKKFLKCESDKVKPSAIEAASESMKNIADRVIEMMKSKQFVSNAPQFCQESLDILHCFVNYMNCSCYTFDPQKILLEKHSKRTPINLPPLLGYFRSPEDESSCDVKSVLDEESMISESSTLFVPQPAMSYFHHSDSSSMAVTCVDTQTPSKTSFRGCLDDEDITAIQVKIPKPVKKNIKLSKKPKRSILREITNNNQTKLTEPAEKKPRNAPTEQLNTEKIPNKKISKDTKCKTKQSKKFKLIAGQGKITSFFTMK